MPRPANRGVWSTAERGVLMRAGNNADAAGDCGSSGAGGGAITSLASRIVRNSVRIMTVASVNSSIAGCLRAAVALLPRLRLVLSTLRSTTVTMLSMRAATLSCFVAHARSGLLHSTNITSVMRISNSARSRECAIWSTSVWIDCGHSNTWRAVSSLATTRLYRMLSASVTSFKCGSLRLHERISSKIVSTILSSMIFW